MNKIKSSDWQTASIVPIAKGSGSPTVADVQKYLDNTGSSGYFIGGELSDGGAGTLDVAAGEGFIRTSADDNAPLLSFKWSASAGIAVPDDTTQYVYVDDAGAISLNSSEFLEAQDKILIGVITDEGGSIESVFNLGVRLEESIAQAGRFIRRIHSISRDIRRGGLIFGETGTRNITLTTGHLWWGRTDYTISNLDTSGDDRFDLYYRASPSGWTKVADQSQWPNTQYDDGSGTLATMLNDQRWAVLWLYIEPDDHVVIVYGRDEYLTQGLANEEAPPNTLPPRLSATGFLAARLVFQRNAATGTFNAAFDIMFVGSAVTDHGDLAGLTDDDHTQYVLDNILTTKGDIFAATGSATPVRLGVGSNDEVLTADSTQGSGVKWAAAAGGGASQTLDNLAAVQIATDLIFADDAVPTEYFISVDAQAVDNTDGNALSINSGPGRGSGRGGDLSFEAGPGGASGDGGDFVLIGGKGFGGGSHGQTLILNPANAKAAILDVSSIASTDKTFTFPNTTGTLALTSDIPAAGATTELDNLGTTAINTSLISDTDSTDDLGSSTKFWNILYVDDIVGSAGENFSITMNTSDGSDDRRVQFSAGGAVGAARGAFVSLAGNEDSFIGGLLTLASGSAGAAYIAYVGGSGGQEIRQDSAGFWPKVDSQLDLGKTDKFWDQTFTDELILTNVGAANAAADKLVLSAIDLSAGNTILDINTEGTGVEGSGTPAADKTIAIRVNGNVRYLLASTVAA